MTETPLIATGRRKESVARVRAIPGSGKVLVNGLPMERYFTRLTHQAWVREPILATQTAAKFDFIARVAGGGISGQAGALRHGLARALSLTDSSVRGLFRKSGLLTRDPRTRERKKYGQKGARKRFQWTKR